MPRLPTIRVIGSQAISTKPSLSGENFFVAIVLPPDLFVTGRQLTAWCAPLRLIIERVGGDLAQPPDGPAVQAAGQGRDTGAGRFIHERHEFVGEARHGATDADAADIGAPANAVDPSAFRYIALHYRSPTPELHDALGRSVFGGEVALLVVAGPVAALVHRAAEEPLRPE